MQSSLVGLRRMSNRTDPNKELGQTSLAFSMTTEPAGEFSDNLFYIQPSKHKELFYTYIIQSTTTGQFFVGSCSDLLESFNAHQNNCSKATRGRGPWWMPYFEIYGKLAHAQARESEIKAKKSTKYIRTTICTAYPLIDLY